LADKLRSSGTHAVIRMNYVTSTSAWL